MEVKAELIKPYTEAEKLNFIATYNHNMGYKIEEQSEKVVALGYTTKEISENKKELFEKEFFNTSLGYIRRKVTMKNGEIKDFLSDLLPTITTAVNMGQTVKVIAYNKPDFSTEVEDWTELQHSETVTAQFIQECFMQLSNDFI